AAGGSAPATATVRDAVAPTAPSSLRVTTTGTGTSVSWSASTDDVGVAGYTVDVDGIRAGTTTSTGFTASDLACGVSHTFAVQAFDDAGNTSSPSVTTAPAGACWYSQPALPIRAAFYYPWFPETWT